jgi:hypothetical protein
MEAVIQETKSFNSKEQYLQYRAVHKTLAHNRCLTASDMIIHNILRGRPEDFGFTPLTKKTKLENGHQSKFVHARWDLWNRLRNWKSKKTEYYLERISNYDAYKKVLTPEIWAHIFSVLQK